MTLGLDARSRAEFLLDASKQFAGAGWIHVMNLGFASALNSMMSSGDECEWYFINIMVDTTLGTAVAYWLLQIANAAIKKRLSPEAAMSFQSGEYKTEDGQIDYNKYIKQLVVWLAIVSCMKILMVVFMFLFSGPLLAFAGFILAPFLKQPWLKLVFVMVVIPLIMDGFQIWMVDNFIKKKVCQPHLEAAQDLEVPPAHIDAAAEALVNFSHQFEAGTETALLLIKARYDEAMQGRTNGEQLHELSTKPGSHNNSSSHFDTKFQFQYQFQTIVPANQDHN